MYLLLFYVYTTGKILIYSKEVYLTSNIVNLYTSCIYKFACVAIITLKERFTMSRKQIKIGKVLHEDPILESTKQICIQ